MKPIAKRVKIVATVGPASTSPVIISSLIRRGVDVFRLNFSHGDRREHHERIEIIRRAAEKLGREVAILADLQGPKIRTRATEGNRTVTVLTGAAVRITARRVPCTETLIAVDYRNLAKEIDAGREIMINDGAIRLKVTAKKPSGDLSAKVLSGGEYASHKGVNFPDVDLNVPSLTAKDRRDLEFILEQDVQYIALSFVRKAEDVKALRSIVQKKRRDIKIIAKIEKPEAARRIDTILPWVDGIMVARGDLGVEATPYVVPIIQKDLIKKANSAGKIVIVATQMLESMIKNAIPTRAESTDVANAIIDGTDAIMLSGETAVGLYPERAVDTMANIAQVTEKSSYLNREIVDLTTGKHSPPHAVCEAAVWAGRDLGNVPLCVYTISGETALYLAKLRYEAPVFAFAPDLQVVRMLSLAWNVRAFCLPFTQDIARLHHNGEQQLTARRLVQSGDIIGIISGTNAVRGATNSLRIKSVGEN
ncbi:MAG: pyruvate kinase [Chitinispirillaceae bacterium]|nr:pyruvate kinase [Chitinispirillaceae bacterium]